MPTVPVRNATNLGIDAYLRELVRRLQEIEPHNLALMPLSLSYEEQQWYVDVSVRRPDGREWDITSHSPDLTHALNNINRRLGCYHQLDRMAEPQPAHDARVVKPIPYR